MLVVTAGNSRYDYQKTIRHCADACGVFGYEMRVYNLGGLGFGHPVSDPRVKSGHRDIVSYKKPELILDAMDYAAPNELVAWIDGDATLIAPIDELEEDTFDVGVTVRPKRARRKTDYNNAGVFFVRNNERGRAFMQHWISLIPKTVVPDDQPKPVGITDQKFLDEMMLSSMDVAPWDAFNTTHIVEGATLKILEGEVYNNLDVHTPETWAPPGRAKILHFRNKTMANLDAYIAEFL
jgi:hypothetical protein